MDLDFVCIECEAQSADPAPLTSALFGALRSFEAIFKAVCCLTKMEECDTCREPNLCPYGIVFNQKVSSDPEITRLHQKPSLPFALYLRETADGTASSRVGIVVIGSALNYMDYFHTALRKLVESAVSTIMNPVSSTIRIYSRDYQGVTHEISPGKSLQDGVILLSARHILQNFVHSEYLRLTLHSPLRLLSNGSISHRFDFAAFFRSQMRRCSSLCAYYGSGELDLDFVQLSALAQTVTVFDDKIQYNQPFWSTRANRAGLIGTVECTGLVEPMFTLLLLGSYFNAGKGAAFGSGFYQVEV